MAASATIAGRAADWLAGLPSPLAARRLWVVWVLALFLGANLPWHLDNYDQAKQAWVAYEIAAGGDWFFQHTPRGGMATKPPAMGWMSTVLRAAGLPWDWAWRLPSLAAAIALLVLLARAGEKLWPGGGGFVAACAFGFNMLSPRLATLVRTDMLLALWIAICGLLILERALAKAPWTPAARLAFGAAMTAALLTKGPVIYVFLLPGMAAYAWLAPAGRKSAVWSGWLSWLAPLGIFLAWGITGLLTRPEFYEQIVVEEFFSRFDQSLKSHERQQPWWFYFPHLLHKFLPWSLLGLALPLASANVRRALRARPELLWLACWALGGLLAMTLVPSKRVDRIFPVIPPLALLVAGLAGACQCGRRIRAWCGAAAVAAALLWTGYFAAVVWLGFREDARGLVNFGRRVAEASKSAVIVGGRDEGLAMYAGAPGFVKSREAVRLFREGRPLVVAERLLAEPAFDGFDTSRAEFSSGVRPSGENYLFFKPPQVP